jgi:hypothetical protein
MPTLFSSPASVAERRSAHGPIDESLLARIVGEYDEMPGLSLTPQQAQRLWRMDEATCRASLNFLVHRRILAVTPRGRYVKRENADR